MAVPDLLAAAYAPGTPPDQKRAAEAALQQLARSEEGLGWALQAFQSGGTSQEALLYAVSVVEQHVTYRWARLSRSQHDAVLHVLWHPLQQPPGQQPHFLVAKCAAAIAHVACLDWPHAYPDFWGQLQALLSEPGHLEAGLLLLTATVEQFHSLSHITSTGLKGKVPYSAIPGIQARLKELQPVALSTLCALLQSLAGGLGAAAAQGDTRTLQLAAAALQALRACFTDLANLPPQQAASSPAVAALLFEFVGAAQAAPAGSAGERDAVRVAAGALDCLADLLTKWLDAAATQQLLEVLVPKMQETCGVLEAHWARRGGQFELEDPLLAAFIRLMVQFFSTQLGSAETEPRLAAGVRALLGRLSTLSFARRSPADVLLFAEVWHSVLTHTDSLEEQLWEVEGDAAAQQAVQQASTAFKEPVLQYADMLRCTLFGAPTTAGGPLPPFTLAALDATPGTGAAMDDWLQGVVAGGDAWERQEQEEERASGAADEADEEASEAEESEVEVYVRHAEGLLARTMGCFSAELLPRVLQRVQLAAAAYAQACGQLASGQQLGGDGVEALRGLDVALRLLGRCSPQLPLRGAEDAPSAAAGSEQVTGAHAAQAMDTLLQLAAGWQQTAQALAAAQDPAAVHGSPALAAVVEAGSRVFRTLSSLTAAWLSQLMLAVMQGSASSEMAALAAQLVQRVFGAAAALMHTIACGPLAAWQPALRGMTLAAAQTLVSLSSVAISSSLKPSGALLAALASSPSFQMAQQAAHQSLAQPGVLPAKAAKALWVSLSDLSLRCWAGQRTVDVGSRAPHLAALLGPLVQVVQQAPGALQGPSGDAPAQVLRQAAAAATAVVQSYAGSPKAVRGVVGSTLVAPLLPALPQALGACLAQRGAGARGRAAAALLQLASATLEVLATGLGPEAVSQLLDALVHVVQGSGGGDASLESDVLLMRLLASVLTQGSQRHTPLLMPALRFCMDVWARAGSPQAAAEADSQHIKAAALASLLVLVRHKWRTLVPAAARPGADAGGTALSTGAHPLAASMQQAAAGSCIVPPQLQAADPAASQEGGAAVGRVLELLVEWFAAAGSQQVVVAAADVRLVLEELYELQVSTRLYSTLLFQPACQPLMAALLGMLVSRLYGAAQSDIVDTLFGLAATNFTDFQLSFLPRWVDHHLSALGAGERQGLLALLSGGDLDAHSFERAALGFANDVAFLERAL